MKNEQIKLSDEQIKKLKSDKQKVVDSTKLVKK
jgi:hypothetical protein